MKKLILFILLLSLCSTSVQATDTIADQDPAFLIQELPQEAEALLEKVDPHSPNLVDSAISVFLNALGRATDSVRQGIKTSAILLIIVLLCGICCSAGYKKSVCVVVGALGIYGGILSSMGAMIRLSETTVRNLTDYSALLLPAIASAMAVSGNPVSAGGLQALTALFAQLFMRIISKILIPGLYLYLAIVACEGALQSSVLGEIRKFLAWLTEKTLRILLFVFTGFLSLTGVISGSADAIAIKTAKTAVSGMVPVVGNILSDASDTLLSGALAIKNTIGILGLLGTLSITIIPFLRVGIQYLIMKLTTAASATVAVREHTAMLDHISTAMGLLLAMTGTCSALLLISGVCFLKVTVI